MLGGSQDQATAWWINFGSYVNAGHDKMIGFTGFGTLGGGDLRVEVGGDAGILSPLTSENDQQINQRTQGIVSRSAAPAGSAQTAA